MRPIFADFCFFADCMLEPAQNTPREPYFQKGVPPQSPKTSLDKSLIPNRRQRLHVSVLRVARDHLGGRVGLRWITSF